MEDKMLKFVSMQVQWVESLLDEMSAAATSSIQDVELAEEVWVMLQIRAYEAFEATKRTVTRRPETTPNRATARRATTRAHNSHRVERRSVDLAQCAA